jgi:hypothetical protein
MLLEDAYTKFINGNVADITKSEAERFFRLDDYVSGSLRAAKIERFRIIASANQELLRSIDFLADLVKGT